MTFFLLLMWRLWHSGHFLLFRSSLFYPTTTLSCRITKHPFWKRLPDQVWRICNLPSLELLHPWQRLQNFSNFTYYLLQTVRRKFIYLRTKILLKLSTAEEVKQNFIEILNRKKEFIFIFIFLDIFNWESGSWKRSQNTNCNKEKHCF